MKDVLILTGNEENNRKVDSLLFAAGFKWAGFKCNDSGFHLRNCCRVVSGGEMYAPDENSQPQNGEGHMLYVASELTPELVATFPGAKQQPPSGPFKFEGKQWVVDGDEKRLPKEGEVYSHPPFTTQRATWNYTADYCWILRPLISDDKQTALDQLAKLQESADKIADDVAALTATIDGMD